MFAQAVPHAVATNGKRFGQVMRKEALVREHEPMILPMEETIPKATPVVHYEQGNEALINEVGALRRELERMRQRPEAIQDAPPLYNALAE